MHLRTLLLAACLWPAVAAAQDVRTTSPGATPPKATVADIGWMAGHWEGEGLGGQSIESISPPVAGQMAGHFQQVKDGKLQFYELYQFAPAGDSLILRIKHFNADLSGWEEKDRSAEFPLVALEKNAVYFDGLTMRLTGEDQLETIVRTESRDGTISDERFRFRRVRH